MLVSYERREANENPIFPFTWEARYVGGGRLKQFDFDGYHYSREIEKARLEALVVHTPSYGELVLALPDDAPGLLETVLIKACNEIKMTLGAAKAERVVWYYFGFVYKNPLTNEEFKYLLEIDEMGQLHTTNQER